MPLDVGVDAFEVDLIQHGELDVVVGVVVVVVGVFGADDGEAGDGGDDHVERPLQHRGVGDAFYFVKPEEDDWFLEAPQDPGFEEIQVPLFAPAMGVYVPESLALAAALLGFRFEFGSGGRDDLEGCGCEGGVDGALDVEFVGVVFDGFAEGDVFRAFGGDGEDDGGGGGAGARDEDEVELWGGLLGDGDEDHLVCCVVLVVGWWWMCV